MTRGLTIAQLRALNVSGRALARDILPSSAMWQIDATKLTLNDQDEVTLWNDEIGSGDLSGSGPTYLDSGLNNNPSVEATSTDDVLDGSDQDFPANNYGRTFIIVHRVKDLLRQNIVSYGALSSPNSADRWVMEQSGDGNPRVEIAGSHVSANDDPYSTGNNYITAFRYSSSSDLLSGLDLWVNGYDLSTIRTGGSSTQPDTNLDSVRVLGSIYQDSMNSQISEIIGYNEYLDGDEFDDEINRLQSKWGVTW